MTNKNTDEQHTHTHTHFLPLFFMNKLFFFCSLLSLLLLLFNTIESIYIYNARIPVDNTFRRWKLTLFTRYGLGQLNEWMNEWININHDQHSMWNLECLARWFEWMYLIRHCGNLRALWCRKWIIMYNWMRLQVFYIFFMCVCVNVVRRRPQNTEREIENEVKNVVSSRL